LPGDGKLLWVEVLSRQQEVLARHKAELGAEPGAELHIGRGYDNDVILDDPYVAARHLRIVRDDAGALVAEDLGSANGLFAGEDRRRSPRVVLDGTRSIRIGRSRLRVRAADHAVAPERIARPQTRAWPLVLALAGALIGIELSTMWLRETGEPNVGKYLGPLLVMCVAVAAWTTAWAIVSRVFSGRGRFGRHLLIAVCGLLVLSLLNELTSYGAFALSRPELIGYRYIVLWLLAAVVCFLHLRETGRSREAGPSHLKLKAAAVAALALVMIGMQMLSQWEASSTSDRQRLVRILKPPALRLAAPQTESAFFAAVAGLKGSLDRARAEPAQSRGFTVSDDDDD
jgi:Inner membrane component of T3SS, cytoplasmic domain